MRELSFYEFTGVLLPGAVILIGTGLMLYPAMTILDLSLGGLGVGVIAAYIAGHLLQAVGNLFETMWWKALGGMPTDAARTALEKLVGTSVAHAVDRGIVTHLRHDGFTRSECDAASWRGIVRQCHSAIRAAGRADRIETFNGNYGLFRGLSTAFLLLLALSAVIDRGNWNLHGFLSLCFVLAMARMHRFARYYARDIFVEFSRVGQKGSE